MKDKIIHYRKYINKIRSTLCNESGKLCTTIIWLEVTCRKCLKLMDKLGLDKL